MVQQPRRSLLLLLAGPALVILVLASVERCSTPCLGQQIGKAEAAKRVISGLAEGLWETADQRKGLRVHQHGDILPKGTRVEPARSAPGREVRPLVCENPSWLFFVDEQPGAHFGHPVRIVLFDAETGKMQSIRADWWPLIDGKPVFDTSERREARDTVVFDRPPAGGGPGVGAAGPRVGRERAAEMVISTVVEEVWEAADQRRGLRAQQYAELLPAGARVQPVFAEPGMETKPMTCANPCWLFFIDEQPGAHFAHPVRIVLLDTETGKLEVQRTEWFPQVNGEPVFATLEARTDRETVIFEKVPQVAPTRREPGEVLGGPSGRLRAHDPCDAWAIIVCGYDDLPDTFDEDTDGIYTVLTGLGLQDDHIFFVSPHTTHLGVDQPTTIANVQWAINQVAAGSDETDKVLFFYSSHGGIDSLSCVPWSPGGGYISAADLDTWLDGITCDELTVIVEACHSGSLIGLYASGSYVATEDDLCADGETNRCIFTSASTDTSSYPDVDWTGDPNPGDTGSETIWGYVEAFSTASADANSDGEISFGEGFQYAWDNDITRIDGVNTPQMVHTGLNVSSVYDYCYRVAGDADLFIADGPGDVGHNSYDYDSTDIWVTQDPAETDHHDVVSGMDNLVHVAVHNRGTTPISNGSLKVYWGDVSTATAWPADFHQIGATDTFGSLAAGATHTNVWTWYVDPSIGLGHNFCLIGVADSPDDPMTGGPSGVTYVAPFDNNIGQKNITIIEDPGHGRGSLQFALKNNTGQSQSVDLVIEWVGKRWGNAVLALPEDLMQQVERRAVKLENLRPVQGRRGAAPGLQVTGEPTAAVRGIALKPGEGRVVSLSMATRHTQPGQRGELRLRQEAEGKVVGALTARLQEVAPDDPGWVARTTVQAFADLAARQDLPAAKQVSELFAKALSGGVHRDERRLLEVVSQAFPLESDIGKRLPRSAGREAQRRIGSALDKLSKAIGARDVSAALRAQGALAEAVGEL